MSPHTPMLSRTRPLALIGVAALLAMSRSAPVQGQSPQTLLEMLPPPTHGDCADGPADGNTDGKRHDAALAKFDAALEAAQGGFDARQKVLGDEAERASAANPSALAPPAHQMMLFSYWAQGKDAEGHELPGRRVSVPAFADSLFGPDEERARTAEQPIADAAMKCEAKSTDCNAKQIWARRQSIRDTLAAHMERNWPQFVDAVRRNLAWNASASGLPKGLDGNSLAVRMQVMSRQGQSLADLKDAGAVAGKYGCVNTAKLTSSAR
jgi:hypothetical protein